MIPINNFADLKQFEASPVAFEMKYPKELVVDIARVSDAL